MVAFIDTAGKKRNGILTVCVTCGKEFATRADKPYKACSQKCKGLARRKVLSIDCAVCGKTVCLKPSRLRKSKSGLIFCGKECKDRSARLNGGIASAQPDFYGTGKKSYRRLFGEDDLVCRRCGYSEFPCGVDIHHMDGDHSNNCKQNLLPLCKCCHAGLHYGEWEIDGDMVQRDDITMAL